MGIAGQPVKMVTRMGFPFGTISTVRIDHGV